MTAEGACAFAWRNYPLLHSDVREDDDRRAALHRYVSSLRDAGSSCCRLPEKYGRTE
jgi:hypothetical protein